MIEQPAVRHQIEPRIRRRYIEPAEHVAPMRIDTRQAGDCFSTLAITTYQILSVMPVTALAECKMHLDGCSRLDIHVHL